ncbi:MAG: hypothetical protein KKB51_09965 [Candidatus Riflebacteria bacterium]|nr:hypothetical protein [Candidatus Riflebacteria bacterium]
MNVPFGSNVTALVPTITHTGASISPNTGVAQNFTNPVTYTVTAADATAQTYVVTVAVAANPAKAITAFDFANPATTGVINEGAKTILLTVPFATNVTALVPTIAHTGSSVSPNTGVAQDFTNPVTYTVTAVDSTTQEYVVTVAVANASEKAITAFNFANPATIGVIDEGAKTIALSVPFGTNVTALVPGISYTGSSVSPNAGVAQDFTNPVTYTVTAADATTKEYVVTVTVTAVAAKAITTFNFASLSITGVIDEGNKTVALTVPFGTDITALVPTITHTGSSVSPNTGVAQNFTNPVTYTVTAADATVQDYVVTVTVAANPAKAITAFNFASPLTTGVVDEGAKTVALAVPFGTDVTALVPTITHTGSSVSPNTGVAQNFTNPVTYTVTAADASIQAYVVTVTVAANPAKAITAFNFASPATTGTVDEGAKTVALIVPYGTNVTALVPTITHTGASVSPNTDVAQDFTNPVTYTVTAADTTTEIYTVTVTVAANPAKAITAFNFASPAATGVVDEVAKTIAVMVPYGTNVTALVPAITHTGASVSPNTGEEQNFTSPVSYTVTAADTTTQVYVVTLTVAANTAKAITAFNFASPATTGVVNESAKTIALTVPFGSDVTALVPTITHTGASVSPNTEVAQNFTNPVTYTVTATDATIQAYVVTVTVAANPAKAITVFNFASPLATGVVDEGAKTVALIVPYGTNVTALVPTITHTGASVSPDTGVAQNFTSPVIYTVTAADTTTQAYDVTVVVAANPAKAITAFNFASPAATGVIDEGAKTVALIVPYGTNVTALVPTITHTGASVSPNTGVAQDFTNPVTYTVTAADSSAQPYVVTVTVAANPAKAITAFNFASPATIGVVDESAKTVALTVPSGTDVTALIPTITHTGASILPNTGVAQNFTNPVTYTVTAADTTVQAYVVTVTVAANSVKAITTFQFNALLTPVSGTVDETSKTVTVKVPYGTSFVGLVPTITHTGASISPNSGVGQTFTPGVAFTYTVTAGDSSTQNYAVTVFQTAENIIPQNAWLNVLEKNIYGGSPTMEYSTNDGSTYTAFGAYSVVNIPGLTVGNRVWVRMQNDDSTKSYLGEVMALSGRADLIATDTIYIGTDNWNDLPYGTAGDAMKIYRSFQNIGDTAGSNADHKIRFYISTDRIINAADTLLVEQAYPFLCPVGAVSLNTTDFTVPALPTGRYYIGAIIDATNVISELNDSNNTTLPDNVAEFEIKDGTALPAGAFKFYNSWGVGFSDENKADGWYWVTYQTIKKQEMMVSYYYNDFSQPYSPSVVASFKITHPLRNEAKVLIGLGDPASPYMVKELQSRWSSILKSGAEPFPGNNIVVDISEFAGAINDYDLFLRVENSGTSLGTIDNFSVEFYYDYNLPKFKTIVGGTGSIPSSANVNVVASTKNSLTLLEVQQIIPLPRAVEETQLNEELPSSSELQSDMESHGVYVPGKNYNQIVAGSHGTGYQPPTFEQWQTMKKLRSVQSSDMRGGQPTSVDHSKTQFFPPVGNQGVEGSCTAFSYAYYIHTFNEAKEHNWNLTGTTWESPDPTGQSSAGRPATNRDKIFSPDFIYHQINSGIDDGSNGQTAAALLARLGGATWSQMPYNTADHTTWPTEAAWREACKYRGSEQGNRYWSYNPVGYFVIKTDADIDLLKTLISSGYCVSTSVKSTSPGLYQLLDANDVADDVATAKMTTDHAQTIVGYKEGADWNPANPDL